MKVIDLLNKIAKGEEVPKKIVWHEVVFDYIDGDYFNDNGCSLFRHDEDIYSLLNMLNDEVEVIEEEKEIEVEDIEEMNLDVDCTSEWNFGEVYDTINQLIRNQKKLIDVINDMRDKE